MNKRRWTLLGFNLLLAGAILAEPGRASPVRDGNPCVSVCVREWAQCAMDGDWDCNIVFNECFKGCYLD